MHDLTDDDRARLAEEIEKLLVEKIGARLAWNRKAYGTPWNGENADTQFLVAEATDAMVALLAQQSSEDQGLRITDETPFAEASDERAPKDGPPPGWREGDAVTDAARAVVDAMVPAERDAAEGKLAEVEAGSVTFEVHDKRVREEREHAELAEEALENEREKVRRLDQARKDIFRERDAAEGKLAEAERAVEGAEFSAAQARGKLAEVEAERDYARTILTEESGIRTGAERRAESAEGRADDAKPAFPPSHLAHRFKEPEPNALVSAPAPPEEPCPRCNGECLG